MILRATLTLAILGSSLEASTIPKEIKTIRDAAFRQWSTEDVTVCYQMRGYEFCETKLKNGAKLSGVRIISDRQTKIEIIIGTKKDGKD